MAGLLGDDDPAFREKLILALQDSEVMNLIHQYADYDDPVNGLHHTLGLRHNQGSYGDHTHNGSDSNSFVFTQATPNISQTNSVPLTAASYERYTTIGNFVVCELYAVCLTTQVASGNLVWTMPYAPHDPSVQKQYGTFRLEGNGSGVHKNGVVLQWVGQPGLVRFHPDGTAVNIGNGDGYLMTAGDILTTVVTYEKA